MFYLASVERHHIRCCENQLLVTHSGRWLMERLKNVLFMLNICP